MKGDTYSEAGQLMLRLWSQLNTSGETKVGVTEYLDQPVAFSSDGAAVVKGVDQGRRKWIRVQIEMDLQNPDDEKRRYWLQYLGVDGVFRGICTLFQRYSDCEDYWTMANNSDLDGDGGMITTFLCSSALKKEEAQVIYDLCTMGLAQTKNDTGLSPGIVWFSVKLVGTKPSLSHPTA